MLTLKSWKCFVSVADNHCHYQTKRTEQLKFRFSVQVLERVVQPLRQGDASSAVCKGLPEHHKRGDTTVGATAGLPQIGKVQFNREKQMFLHLQLQQSVALENSSAGEGERVQEHHPESNHLWYKPHSMGPRQWPQHGQHPTGLLWGLHKQQPLSG